MALEISAARPDPALLDLPWRIPLEEWPEDLLAALPRGISRHVVRFVRLSGRVLAVKEIKADLARREYELLRSLNRLNMPCVEPFAVVCGRLGLDGEPLDERLLTAHHQLSLPYPALYNQNHFFAPNPIGRYSVGTRNRDLKYAEDGSLTLYVQADPPSEELRANWLPTPPAGEGKADMNGDFSLYIRAYWPKAAALEGAWTPPPVENTD